MAKKIINKFKEGDSVSFVKSVGSFGIEPDREPETIVGLVVNVNSVVNKLTVNILNSRCFHRNNEYNISGGNLKTVKKITLKQAANILQKYP
jgi:hypothetical protein